MIPGSPTVPNQTATTIATGRRRRVRATVAACVAAGLITLLWSGPATAAPPPSAVVVATTTTTDVVTTTTAPPTTTTVPPATTTTVPPTTTTSRPPRTTTTTTTPTTTTAPATSASSSTPWGLVVLVVVLVLAILGVILLLGSRRKRAAEEEWRQAVIPALSDAQLARESLLSGNAVSEDPQVRAAVDVQVERAAVALERTVPGAPDEQAGVLASSAAIGLRGLAFANEADRLLRHGTAAPSGVQLAQADEARRARVNELGTALARLSARISASAKG